jgi:hypothetical protein
MKFPDLEWENGWFGIAMDGLSGSGGFPGLLPLALEASDFSAIGAAGTATAGAAASEVAAAVDIHLAMYIFHV